MGPDISHHPLSRADGSASFSSALFSVLAAVNGPVEVQRRDELPEEAAIEVNIRPSSGVGGPRERWLESVVAGVLKTVLLVHMHPRTLIQITLQITKEPATKLQRAVQDIAVLPTLINASFLVLVDGGLPLATTLAAALVAEGANGEVLVEPSDKDLSKSKGVHAFAYNSHGELLMNESSGAFNMKAWEGMAEAAANACAASLQPNEDEEMGGGGTKEATPWLRLELEEKAKEGSAWRDAT